MTSNSELPPNAIAVVGMAASFPAPTSVSAFWDNLRRGEESIVTLSEEELLRRRGQREGAGDPRVRAARRR